MCLAAACGPPWVCCLAVPVGGLLAGVAGADSSCYTGCGTTAGTVIATSGTGTAAKTQEATTASSGLAFTGADIEEMAVIGAAAIGVGTLLVVRSRRRPA